MRTVREKVIEQIRLQEKMQSLAKVNLVNCGNCGATLLHEMNEEQIDCFACGNMIDQSDCPDYWYSGLENSEEYNREEMTPYEESQRVNSDIDTWAIAMGIEVNEPVELTTIIKQENIENAKKLLKREGYYVDNLWQTCDVTMNYDCTEKQAQIVLNDAMNSEAVMQQIWDEIKYRAGFLKLKEI